MRRFMISLLAVIYYLILVKASYAQSLQSDTDSWREWPDERGDAEG